MVITTISPGIYEAAGSGLFRTYMIVAHPRYGGSYPWLNALTDSFTDHDRTHVKQLLKEVDESPDANREAVLELLMKANPELIQKIKKEEDQRVDTTFLLRIVNKIPMEGVTRDKVWS